MLESFLFAVFSYCTFKLAIKRIDKSIIILCILSWFWYYPQRGTEGYRFGFFVVSFLLVVESITRQRGGRGGILTYPLFIYFFFQRR